MDEKPDASLEPTPEQIRYAGVLEKGMYIGLVCLFVTFGVYVFGIREPYVSAEKLPEYWKLKVDEYLTEAKIAVDEVQLLTIVGNPEGTFTLSWDGDDDPSTTNVTGLIDVSGDPFAAADQIETELNQLAVNALGTQVNQVEVLREANGVVEIQFVGPAAGKDQSQIVVADTSFDHPGSGVTASTLKDGCSGAGWHWVRMLGYGDFVNFIGVAILAGVTILCYIAIIPMLLKRKDFIYAVLALLEVVVLLVAASGIIAVGH
jgi:hypothetical protein